MDIIDFPQGKRVLYNKALKALQTAHDACFKEHKDVLGMSSGPFSGVNEALGIIARLEDESDWFKKKGDEQRNEH